MERTFKSTVVILLWLSESLVSVCPVFAEEYNSERARTLNFQRLLEQEQQRTAELDSEIKQIKEELAEFVLQSRELSAQVRSARDQMGRLQQEAQAINDSAMLTRKAMEDPERADLDPPRRKRH